MTRSAVAPARPKVIRAALTLLLIAAAPAYAAPSLWDDVAHADRQHCRELVATAEHVTPQNTRAAVQTLRTVGVRCGGDRDALQSAGELLLSLREFGDARLVLERARQLADADEARSDRDASLAFHLGFAREVTGDVDGAIEEHRRLEAMGGLPPPNQYLVHYDLGDELMAAGRLSEAIDEYRRAVALAPDKPVPRLALAVALDRDGQLDRARAEANVAVTLDPDLRRLSSDEYVFVPAADLRYYRALALLSRGSVAEARIELRAFLRELPDGPYVAVGRERLAEAERLVDARELEVSSAGLDTRVLAHALGALVGALEDCLPDGRVIRLRLAVARASLRTAPGHPAAACLDPVLNHANMSFVPVGWRGWVGLPLAGRRSAASRP